VRYAAAGPAKCTCGMRGKALLRDATGVTGAGSEPPPLGWSACGVTQQFSPQPQARRTADSFTKPATQATAQVYISALLAELKSAPSCHRCSAPVPKAAYVGCGALLTEQDHRLQVLTLGSLRWGRGRTSCACSDCWSACLTTGIVGALSPKRAHAATSCSVPSCPHPQNSCYLPKRCMVAIPLLATRRIVHVCTVYLA